jgi:hypothetical protein
MPSRSFGSRTLLLLLWMAAFAIIPVYIHFDHVGWDLGVYARAAHELQAGHDPYADGIEAENDLFGHRTLLNQDRTMLPYLYPPVTLPVLRAIGGLSIRRRFWTGLYWLLYVAGVLTQVYVGVQFSELRERRVLVLVAPAIMFFRDCFDMTIFLEGISRSSSMGRCWLRRLRAGGVDAGCGFTWRYWLLRAARRRG